MAFFMVQRALSTSLFAMTMLGYASASCAMELKLSTQLTYLPTKKSATSHSLPFNEMTTRLANWTTDRAIALELSVWPPFDATSKPSQQVEHTESIPKQSSFSRIGFLPDGMSYALSDNTSIQLLGTSVNSNASQIWQSLRLINKESDSRQWFLGINKAESTSKDELTAGIGVLLNLK